MSGGSWDYVFLKFEEVSEHLKISKEPIRRALGKHMDLVAKAMHDIECVDSDDFGPGDEIAAIERALGKNAPQLELQEIILEAQNVQESLGKIIKKVTEKG